MKAVAIIPARMNSSRFPGKPMAKILGMPMIGHCYLRTKMCLDLDDTYVATCDDEIFNYIISIGGKAIMTSESHERATDRTAEAMMKVEQSINERIDIIVMVQGDEPMITPEMISLSLSQFKKDPSLKVINLMAKMESIEDFEDPNEVKVVVNKDNDALYFSREPVPSRKKGIYDVPMMKQVCIIPFIRDYLIEFNGMAETPLEVIESVDMMRILENGDKVRMVYTEEESYSVDTEEDKEKVEKKLIKDKLVGIYLK